MTSRSVPDPHAATAQFERQLLARLGLGAGASNEEIERAHDEIVAYVEAAPGSLRAWSRASVAAADEAYALLRGPRADLVAATTAAAPVEAVPAGRPGRAAATSAPAAAIASEAEPADWLEESDLELQMKGGTRRRGAQRRAALAANRLSNQPEAGLRLPFGRRIAIGAVGLVGVAAVIFGVYLLGAPSVPGFTGTPAPEASQGAVDQAQVTALMQKLAANPNDATTLEDLGNLYYGAGDYTTAATWFDKLVALDGSNVNALLALGAARFNLGDLATAEANWLKVVEIDPNSVEAHYDLGFVYLSQNPPDLDKARAEWNKVIAIAPDSDAAKQAATHLASLSTPAPSGSVAPSASPAASASPEASSSPAPTETPTPSPAPSAS
jgi:tetratricopeptide (TPR) repeat protein